MRPAYTVAVAFALFASTAFAQYQKEIVILGVGASSCAEYANLYRKNPTMAEEIYVQWGLGFLGGRNYESILRQRKPVRFLPVDGRSKLAAHVRDLCDRRPLMKFRDAVLEYFESLPASN